MATQIPNDPLRSMIEPARAPSLDTVTFTQQQLALLEREYPERHVTDNMTDAQIRTAASKRSVILFIKGRTR